MHPPSVLRAGFLWPRFALIRGKIRRWCNLLPAFGAGAPCCFVDWSVFAGVFVGIHFAIILSVFVVTEYPPLARLMGGPPALFYVY